MNNSDMDMKKKDKFLIDTNVLVYIFMPSLLSSKDTEKYADCWYKLTLNKNKIYINSLIVSEFINVSLRNDFNTLFNAERNKNFKKDYRKSKEYEKTLHIILEQLKKILKYTTQMDDNFSNINIFEEYNKNKEADFNDLIIARNVLDNNLKLITNDKDFKEYDIDTIYL